MLERSVAHGNVEEGCARPRAVRRCRFTIDARLNALLSGIVVHADDHAVDVNSIAQLPPELRRRFTFGTFFFDLPTPDERAAIWALYMLKFGLTAQPLPKDEGWTGAEIRQCTDLAWRLGITLDIELVLSAAFKEFRKRQRERSRGAGGTEPHSLTAIEIVRRQEIARGTGVR